MGLYQVPLIAAALATRPTGFWIDVLEKVAVPCGPVNTLEQVFNHPQLKHRQMVRQIPDGDDNLFDTIASPINLSANKVEYRSAPPELGEHTRQILLDELGVSSLDFDELVRQGVIG